MDVFGEHTPIAIKEQVCDLCHGTIKKGEKYARGAYADSYCIGDIRVHILCKDVLTASLERGQNEFTWYEVEDAVRDVCSENNLCTKDTPLSEMVKYVDAWNRRV